jgi:UDP-glucuronate 4-epimerase
VGPYRVVNIGNSTKVPLMDFIREIERVLGFEIRKNLLDMQMGDVPATWADTRLLQQLTGFVPKTSVSEGIEKYVAWYRSYYRV